MRRYSRAERERAIELYDKCHNVKRVAAELNISRPRVIYSWLYNRYKEPRRTSISLGAGIHNDVVDIANTFTATGKVHFVHLRNVKHESETDFHESAHLSSCGDLDMFAIVKALYENGFDGYIRPDHGRMIWGEVGRPGYGLYDRALGAAYINGLWEAVSKLC